jgi:hypothetical protein
VDVPMNNPLNIALGYIARGWSPLPVPYRSKNPGIEGWSKLRITSETAPEYFNGGPQNIGVLLGEPSADLQDVDLDTPEAIAVAPHLLPPTGAIFGRKGAPDAHWLYIIADGAKRTKSYNDPEKADDDDQKARVVELRGTGGHTIFPGSTHKDTGELIEWSEDGQPARIEYGELQRAVALVAVAALLAQHWAHGTRDDLCTATVGVLLRAGFDDEDIETMLRAIAEAADDEKIEQRIEKIERLRDQLHIEGAVFGYPKLAELTSAKVAESVRKWLKATHADTAHADIDSGEYAGVDSRVLDELKALPPDVMVLPNDHVPYRIAALRIFTAMARGRELFVRGGTVVELNHRTRKLTVITGKDFRSRLESSHRRVKAFVTANHGAQLLLKPKRCSADQADVLLATLAARDCLPSIELIAQNPVLMEHAGKLSALDPGYHEIGGGVMVLGGAKPPIVPLSEAVTRILELTADFQFAAPADQSRAVANFIGPALRMGALLPGHALINGVEANGTQTGKGYLLACQREPYGENVKTIAKREGGVGSLDESIAEALFSGAPFVCIDNLRGRVHSQYLEMLLTCQGKAPVRVPHRGEIDVDISKTTFQLTSNGFEATPDLANRTMITRLIKQPAGYSFKRYPEGALLAHIAANRPYYLGCIFAVVRQWHAAGRPALPARHSFADWVGALDWIVQNVFKLPPLLEGHEDAVQRISTPGLSWLRLIAHEVVRSAMTDKELTAIQLVELSDGAEIEMPGAQSLTDDMSKARQVGVLMAKCFKDGNDRVIDNHQIRRIVRQEMVSGKREEVKRYLFGKPGCKPQEKDDEM